MHDEIATNHSPDFAPALQPMLDTGVRALDTGIRALDTGVRALVTAAMAWLGAE